MRSGRCKNFLRSVRAPVLDHDRISHGPRGGPRRAATPLRAAPMTVASRARRARARAITSSRPGRGWVHVVGRQRIFRRWRTVEEGEERLQTRDVLKSQGPGPIRVRRPVEDRSHARTHARTVHVRTPSLVPCLLSHFAFIRSFTFTNSLPQGSLSDRASLRLWGSDRYVVRMAHIPQAIFFVQKSLAYNCVG